MDRIHISILCHKSGGFCRFSHLSRMTRWQWAGPEDAALRSGSDSLLRPRARLSKGPEKRPVPYFLVLGLRDSLTDWPV